LCSHTVSKLLVLTYEQTQIAQITQNDERQHTCRNTAVQQRISTDVYTQQVLDT